VLRSGSIFWKSFQTGHICEKFSPKGPTSKKFGLNSSMATTHVIENNIADTPYFYCSYSILSWRTRKEKHHEIMDFLALFSFHFFAHREEEGAWAPLPHRNLFSRCCLLQLTFFS
jgi:hypothetical protein